MTPHLLGGSIFILRPSNCAERVTQLGGMTTAQKMEKVELPRMIWIYIYIYVNLHIIACVYIYINKYIYIWICYIVRLY
jgi:hypothetical protein